MQQVSAAVVIENGRLLLAERRSHDHLEGMWELPGGKVEPGETAEECLIRELNEELSMSCQVGALVATARHVYAHGSFEVLAFSVQRTSDYELHVHSRARWVSPRELEAMPIAPADVELIDQITLSGLWSTRSED